MGTKARTLKQGTSAADRAIIYQRAQAAGGTAAPDATITGFHLQGADWLHVDVDFPAAPAQMTQAQILPWYWSDAAGIWVAGDQLQFTNTAPNARNTRIEVRGKNRVWFQVVSLTGPANSLFSLWASYAHEVRSTD